MKFHFIVHPPKEPILTINKDTSYFKIAATFIETEFVLYGKVNEEGGKQS
ncbi:MAG: hypothetical protein IPK57_10950 [Chitinophagaceae bacterium]|nr:hypothetical protein [Chitinophagaceae bacterium]